MSRLRHDPLDDHDPLAYIVSGTPDPYRKWRLAVILATLACISIMCFGCASKPRHHSPFGPAPSWPPAANPTWPGDDGR